MMIIIIVIIIVVIIIIIIIINTLLKLQCDGSDGNLYSIALWVNL